MTHASGPRRPISRRLMVALFVLMIVPISGWYFLGELTSRQVWGDIPFNVESDLQAVQEEIRFKLALTLGASLVVLGAIVFYLRRVLIDPLDRLAARARAAETDGWQAPEECARPDEIGDLAHALDRSIPAMERRAEEARHFAVNLSHELRTPLAAIRGAAEILAESRPGAEDQERFLRNILTESERLERLVAGLLDLERGAEPHQRMDEPVDPKVVVDDVVARCAPLLERKSLRAKIEQAPGLPMIAVDKRRLERILFGLLENAIKFSPEGGRITIRTGIRQGDLLVEIDDEGPGVPMELREEIFNRYFTRGRGGASGTGLGLAIVRSLATAVGGSVWADETPEGGARFCCLLDQSGDLAHLS